MPKAHGEGKEILNMIMNRIDIKPMSVNKRSTVIKGRITKTKSYQAYCDQLFYMLPRLPQQRFSGLLRLTARMGLSNPSADLDNTVKPFQDALQLKYKFNDSQVYELHLEKVVVPVGKEFIEFMIEQIEGGDS